MNTKMSQSEVPVSSVIVKNGSTISVIKNDVSNRLLLRCVKVKPVYKEEIIYNKAINVSCPDLEREFPDLSIIHRLNTVKGSISTIAKYNNYGSVAQRTSAQIIKVIGQKNYDTVISALSTVNNKDLSARAILALLTVERPEVKPHGGQKSNAICQTEETSRKLLMSMKQRSQGIKRARKKPYVVHYSKDRPLKRVVVDPKSFLKSNSKPENEISKNLNQSNENPKTQPGVDTKETPFPDLKEFINEDSNFSDISIGNVSLRSQHYVNIPEVLENPFELMQHIEQHTEQNIEVPNCVPLNLTDGSTIMVCMKPTDKFHWATPDILRNLPQEQRTKLMYQQACIDWQCCMEMDEDGYLPIHHAVMSNDLDFLKRQCTVLKNKYGSVDYPASGNMTALQMSINKDGEACTSMLLKYGADPLQQDDEGKSFFHTASEVSHDHLRIALEHCRENARQILKQDTELWNPEMEKQSDEELSKFLLDTACLMVDNAGYTPLMLASKQGNFRSTKLLVEASPDTINRPMPNSGSTALYLAVGAAYMEVIESSNHTKIPEHYMKTIEILVANGADPKIENHAGSNVNMLLAEFNIVDLFVLIANNLTSVKYFDDKFFDKNNINSYMLLKNSDGEINLTKIKNKENDDKQNEVPSTSKENTNTSSNPTNKNKSETKLTGNKSTPDVTNKSNKQIDKGNKTNLVDKCNKLSVSSKTSSDRTAMNTDQITKHVADKTKTVITQADIPKFIKILPKPDPRLTELGKHKVEEDMYPESIKKSKRSILKPFVTCVKPGPSKAKTVDDSNVPDNTETIKRNCFVTPKTPNIILKVQKGALKPIETAKFLKVTDQSKLSENALANEKCTENNKNQSTIKKKQQVLRQLLKKKRDELQES